jgi:hypothetical protein
MIMGRRNPPHLQNRGDMLIENITLSSSMVPAGGSSGWTAPVAPQASSGGGSVGGLVISVGQDIGFRPAYEGKEAISTTVNMVASNIRVADQAMSNAGHMLTSMKSMLNAALTKSAYQPLQHDRIRLIGEYVAARMLMVKNTVPPEYHFAWKIISDPSVDKEAGDQTVALSPGGQTVTVRNQPITIGGSGLNIPDLSVTASDEQISATIGTLAKAQTSLSQNRAALASDAAKVIDSIGSAVKSTNADIPWPLTLPDTKDATIADKSKEVGRTISSDSHTSLTGKNSETIRLFL